MNRWKLFVVVCAALYLAACANVAPYHREVLSMKEMQFDSEKAENAARHHFLNSIEASSSAFGVGGGGCGCN